MRPKLFFFIAASVVLCISFVHAAKTPVFTTYKVPKDAGFARLSDVAVSPDGLVMAVWEQGGDGILNRVRYSILDPRNGIWTPPRDIPNLNVIGIPGVSRHEWPRVCSGGDGEFFLTWGLRRNPRTHDEHTWDTAFAHYKGGLNGSFNAVEVVKYGNSCFPTISYNARTKTPSVWWEETIAFPWRNYDPRVSHRIEGQWTQPESLCGEEGIYALSGGRVKPAVPDEHGNMYAVWEQKTQIVDGTHDYEIFEVSMNYTRNGQWTQSPLQLTRYGKKALAPKVAVSPDGKEAYALWFRYDDKWYYGQHITFSGENLETVNRGSIVHIAYGHHDHKWYNTGLVHHGDRFYFAYISDGVVRMKTYHNGQWSPEFAIPSIDGRGRWPRYAKMGSSPKAGLAVSWQTNSVASTEDVYVAYAPFPVSGIHPVAWAQQINVREKSLFFENNYNEIRWVNSEDNIVDEVNKASRFLVFRIEQGQVFDFDATPHHNFNSATPSAGFEIIQSNRTYRFIEKLSQADSRKSYQYAIVAVDENDNRSEAVIAVIEN